MLPSRSLGVWRLMLSSGYCLSVLGFLRFLPKPFISWIGLGLDWIRCIHCNHDDQKMLKYEEDSL